MNNFAAGGAFYKLQQIPSIKIDHNFGTSIKISGYYSLENTDKSNGVDGLPEPLSLVRIQEIRSKTLRLNYDQTSRADSAVPHRRRVHALQQSRHRSAGERGVR